MTQRTDKHKRRGIKDNKPTRGRTETYIHREGRGNRTQVEHMRTGADNHKDGKQDKDRK